MSKGTLLINCGCILTMDAAGTVLRDTTIVSENGKIKELLPIEEAQKAYPEAEVFDAMVCKERNDVC